MQQLTGQHSAPLTAVSCATKPLYWKGGLKWSKMWKPRCNNVYTSCGYCVVVVVLRLGCVVRCGCDNVQVVVGHSLSGHIHGQIFMIINIIVVPTY